MVSALIPYLEDDSVAVRWSVADLLGRIGDAAAVAALAERLADEEDGVREIAAVALEAIGGEEAERALEGREG